MHVYRLFSVGCGVVIQATLFFGSREIGNLPHSLLPTPYSLLPQLDLEQILRRGDDRAGLERSGQGLM
jgi:hypothetical protein